MVYENLMISAEVSATILAFIEVLTPSERLSRAELTLKNANKEAKPGDQKKSEEKSEKKRVTLALLFRIIIL